MTKKLIEIYNNLVATNTITDDKKQKLIIEQLDILSTKLTISLQKNSKNKKNYSLISNLLDSLFNIFRSNKEQNNNNKNNNNIKGLYIYGGVGRGKSMLMDMFFKNIPIKKKSRVHFHAFMLEIHDLINKHRTEKIPGDALEFAAQTIAKQANLLCFDEIQITDIADAMIVGRFFEILFKNNVIVIATSNRHPDDLYKNGLQRDSFLPFIKLFKQKLNIISLDGDIDYRLQQIHQLSKTFLIITDKESNNFINKTFKKLTNNATPQKYNIHLQGRILPINKAYADIAVFTFHELCNQPLGPADYIEISRNFNTILLQDIPKMNKSHRNEAKRFINLIDELYEHNVKLICTAQTTINNLYLDGDGSFEFQRTISRLHEMQSDNYLHKEHIS